MMTRHRTAVAIIAAAMSMTVLTGCEGYREARGLGDAPVAPERDDTPAHVINMPDRFGNVAWKCVGPDKVYVTSYASRGGGAIDAVPNHPECVK